MQAYREESKKNLVGLGEVRKARSNRNMTSSYIIFIMFAIISQYAKKYIQKPFFGKKLWCPLINLFTSSMSLCKCCINRLD